MNQILLIDKPAGWTSFDVVARIRGEIRKKLNGKSHSALAYDQRQVTTDAPKRIKVGHSGTLDPFATGLLIILVGGATKEQDKYMKLDKEYEATLRLGFTSTTGDPEGTIAPYVIPTEVEGSIVKISPCTSLSRNDIEEVIKKFIGQIKQTPPAHSAIKVDGKRAYKLARAGKEVVIKPRDITIYKLEILNYKWQDLKIRVNCSSGTYIRTLGEDIGKALGCGAYLTELRRTKIGAYSIESALSVESALGLVDTYRGL